MISTTNWRGDRHFQDVQACGSRRLPEHDELVTVRPCRRSAKGLRDRLDVGHCGHVVAPINSLWRRGRPPSSQPSRRPGSGRTVGSRSRLWNLGRIPRRSPGSERRRELGLGSGAAGQCRVDRSRNRRGRGLPSWLRGGPGQGRHWLEPRAGDYSGLSGGPSGVYGVRGRGAPMKGAVRLQ
jgi:hypothetical protein